MQLEKIRVVHISTSSTGGAGNAAMRLHQGLRKKGVESHFLCLYGPKHKLPNVHAVSVKYPHFIRRGLYNKLGIPTTSEQKNANALKGKEGNYEIFSFPTSSYDLSTHSLVQEADIIHLHWVANFLDYPSFFKNCPKPIVWTLHDMNPFQGGFHYQEDVERNDKVFRDLENQLCQKKINALKHTSNIHVVCPSKWLFEESRNSESLGEYPHFQFSYGLDLNLFKPLPKAFARSVFNLPSDKNILLFVSESVQNRRKGFDLLLKAVKELSLSEETIICAVGKNTHSENISGIVHLGRVQDERLMPLLYSAADAFVLPSREDNLPNVMLESLACGTPVISFPVGGMLDVIKNGLNGILASEVSSTALQEAIEQFIRQDKTFDRERIRAFAVAHFDQALQAKRYIELYSTILAEQKTQPTSVFTS